MNTKFIYIIFLLFANNLIFAQQVDLSQKISLQAKNQSIEQVIRLIEQKTNLAFSYSKRSINAGRKISIQVKNSSVKDILNKLSEQTSIQYSLIEKQIVLRPIKGLKKVSPPPPLIPKHTLSGFLSDKITGEALIAATVFILDNGQGTTTNEFGFFSLTIPEGQYDISFSYIGYNQQRISIDLQKNTRLKIALEHTQLQLPQILLSVKENRSTLDNFLPGKLTLTTKDMKSIPEFAGEVGLVKTLQTLPGVKTHSDGSAYFFVRGGNKDQNLVIIDDAPVYNHAHLFGFFSIFIPEFTKGITIYKNDIPVNQGDRLAALIDIRTKDGNLNKWGLTGIYNPLVSTIAFEGPLKKEKSSIFVSLRRSNFDWLYQKKLPNLKLFFSDIHLKFNTKINDNNRLYFTVFRGDDVIENFNTTSGAKGGISWGNGTLTTRWNHIFSDKLFLNTLIYTSAYQYVFTYNNLLWTSSIANISLKADFSNYITPDLTLRFGYNQNIHAFNPGNILRAESIPFLPKVPQNQSIEKVFYFNSEHTITDKFSYNAGFRLPIWSNLGPTTTYRFDENYEVTDTLFFQKDEPYEKFISIDPRLSFRYSINEQSALKISYGRYHQFMQMLSNSTTPFTSLDVWIPSSSNIKPQEAHQFALGYYRTMPQHHLTFSAETYYKNMKNQIDYKPHAKMLLNPLVEGELRIGKAWSYGLELLLKKTEGRLTGWAGYTYSRTFKQTNGINEGRKYPAFYDRPHDFSIFLSYKVSKRTNISANWVYYTGSAISTPVGFYEYNGQLAPIYGDKNNDRFPNYHRLDIAINFKLNKRKRKFNHELNFSIYNLYMRKNPVSLNFNKIRTSSGQFVVPADIYHTQEIVPSQTILVQFMPSLTYKFKI